MKKHKKTLHFCTLIFKSKNKIKTTWEIIKELIVTAYCNHQSFPKSIVIDKENITYEGLIAKHCSTCFAKIETNPSKMIETSLKFDSIQPENPLSINELKNALFKIKMKKVLAMMTLVLMSSGIVLVLS